MSSRRTADEQGLSLIELIVVVVLIGIMGTAMVAIFVNSWKTQNTVMSTSQATNTGQLVGQSIERAVRNADAIAITGDGRYLAARVVGSGGTYTCRAYWVRPDAAGGSLVMSSRQPLLTPASATWPPPWIDNSVVSHGGALFFVQSASSPVTIMYQFDVRTTAAPVTFTGRVSTRNSNIIVSTDANHQGALPCWS